MIKLLMDIGGNKKGTVTTYGNRMDNNLVKKGYAVYVKIDTECYKYK